MKRRLKGEHYWNVGEKVKPFQLRPDAEKFVSEMPEDEYEYYVEVESDFEYECRKLHYEWIWKDQTTIDP